ncbi:DUF4163 domain-containing protein [Sphingosinicella soli]|uniref:Deacetylase PdaC domain-containing protein n=1 Tax=Sphingosinicella soli TaxID=333708 RepID=A0A7W7B2B5_9SPHN|nr:DUF4163 domain-containing protein [Sphingosinicella soli]MBB4631788.1 hypothetical protein [Sphingosinicella soli]
MTMRAMALWAMLALAACDGQKAKEASAGAETARPQTAPAADVVVPASDLLVKRDTAELDFLWRAPPELAEAPTLLATLRAQALESAKEMQAGALEDMKLRPADAPKLAHFFVQDWTVAADTDALLNIRADISMYTGGAHPNHGFAVKYWDKAERREISFGDLFTDWSAAETLLTPAYCSALDAERLSRRGEIQDGIFNDCPPLGDQPVALVSWPGQDISGFRVLLGPYVAGSYAEGDFEIDVPMTDALRALIKPQYLKAQ